MKRQHTLKYRPLRIKPPMFWIGKMKLNEYELRQIMVDVKQGRLRAGIEVTDELGHSTTIREDGRLVGDLHRFNLSGLLALELI